MKRIIIILSIFILIITGCENMKNTPTAKVEEFLGKYQRMDIDVLEDLKNSIKKDKTMNEEQKKDYQTLLEKQYQNLSYKIKKEEIRNSTAIVEVEIEVFDYQTSINHSKKYYQEHEKDNDNYINYKLSELKKVTSRVKKDLTFQLEKENNMWQIKELSQTDIEKIHGLY